MYSSSLKTEFAADKKISFDETKQQFIISYNKTYLLQYGFMFLVIGIFFAVTFAPAIQRSFWLGTAFFAVIAFPFIAFGVRFLYLSFQKDFIVIDLIQKNIRISKTLTIPFNSIHQFSLTQVNFYDPEYPSKFLTMRKVSSWQITIEDFKENKIILCKSEKKGQAKKIVEEFSQSMGVKMKEGIEIC